MSGININTITENASRFGMRIQESLSEHTRDLTLAGGTGFFDTTEDKLKNIRYQLESNSDREKLEAMKRLIAMISKGRNVSEYFAQVVKNVASNNLEIRKLVYIYLLRYAEQEPDLALLSINTFQKDLTDPSPLIRAMALRVLSGIRVSMIGSIVVLAIKKCAADISPYVRKAASLAIPKCYALDQNCQPALIGIITTLLRDRSPLSIGTVAVAFEAVCPTRLDLLHPHYRRLCRLLVDVDEWGQIAWLNLLNRYARTMLPKPFLVLKDGQEQEEVDPDLQLLLTSSVALFQSRNPAVVLAVSRTFYYIGAPSQVDKTVQPLLRLLGNSVEVERIVLAYLLVVAHYKQALLAPHYFRFLVRASDIKATKISKLRLLMSIVSVENHQVLLREFIQYAEDPEDELVESAIAAIGYCARVVPDCTPQALSVLMTFIQSKHDIVVKNAVLVLKSLVQTHLTQESSSISLPQSQSPLSIISRLAYMIDDIRHQKAKACAIWLVGQYSASTAQFSGVGIEGINEWVPDVLRRTVKSFCAETPDVKLQIITLASKLLVLNPNDRILCLLGRHVFSLARYDLNYDVRDRARLLSTLLSGIATNLLTDDDEIMTEKGGVVLRRDQVRMVLFDGKATVVENYFQGENEQAILGSLGMVTRKDMSVDYHLPDWLEEGTESSLRDSEDDALQVSPAYTQGTAPRAISSNSVSGVGTPSTLTPTGEQSFESAPYGGSKSTWQDLDKFYAEEDDEEDEDEDDEGQEGEAEDSADDTEGNEGTDSGDETTPVRAGY